MAGRGQDGGDPEHGGDQRRDHRADGDDRRALALCERLELLARCAVSLLVARGDLRPRRSAARALRLWRSARLRSRPAISARPRARTERRPQGARPPPPGRRRRGSPARRRPARRRRPTTSATFPVSIPPIANQGIVASRAAYSTSPRPVARPALLGRRLPHRPDADLVGALRAPGRARRVDLLRANGSTARPAPRGRRPRAPRPPACRPGRRGRRRRRRPRPGRAGR